MPAVQQHMRWHHSNCLSLVFVLQAKQEVAKEEQGQCDGTRTKANRWNGVVTVIAMQYPMHKCDRQLCLRRLHNQDPDTLTLTQHTPTAHSHSLFNRACRSLHFSTLPALHPNAHQGSEQAPSPQTRLHQSLASANTTRQPQ